MPERAVADDERGRTAARPAPCNGEPGRGQGPVAAARATEAAGPARVGDRAGGQTARTIRTGSPGRCGAAGESVWRADAEGA